MDRDKGYRYDYLYLPISRVAPFLAATLKRSLTFDLDGSGPVQAWKENYTHLLVPREQLIPEQVLHLPFDVVDICPRTFPRVDVGLTFGMRDEIQETSRQVLLANNSGVLSLSCGKGKTVIALHAWAATHVPAVVVVPTKDLAWQWRTRILEHTTVQEDEIGILSGPPDKWDWKKPISIATVHALARASEHLPKGAQQHWGLMIFDEVHRLGAPYFNRAASTCLGRRWGLSATPGRKDGLDALYQSHIGRVVFQNLQHEHIPEVFFVRTGVGIPDKDLPDLTDRSGELQIAKIYTWLGEHEKRNRIVCTMLKTLNAKDRVTLTLTERVSHIKDLHLSFPEAGVIHGAVKGSEREAALKNHEIILAITQLARDGLDRSDLNTVLITMPFTDRGRFEQIIGRAQRAPDPIVIILEDEIEICRRMCARLRTHLRDLNYPFRTVDRSYYGEREEDGQDGGA
tara:strand:- start:150 stop:1520 length:1371 start_codon:yes stop_codon:yes gene_type:complete